MPQTQPNKIAILGSFPPLRGVSSYCLELSQSLASRVRIQFISFKSIYPRFLYPGGDLKDDRTFPEIECEGITVRRRLTWYNPLSWFTEGLFTPADLLHAQWWSTPLAPVYAVVCLLFKIRRKPIVFTVHNVMSHEKSLLFALVSRWLFKLGDHFIVHTEKNRRQMIFEYRISHNQISVIPHGSLDFQVNREADRNQIREEMGFSPDNKIVLFFGAIRPYKGLDTAIRAFADVVKAVPQARLLIAGKLWETWKPYQELIDELRLGEFIVTHLEYIPSAEVHRYFCAADVAVAPYHHFDSQSGVGSTAVAFRTPMIVSNVGGLPNLVADTRWVVPPKSVEALGRTMTECLKHPAILETMGSQLNAVALTMSWKRIAQATHGVYKEIFDRVDGLQVSEESG